jgi:tetratricopeptide (TPR) repeat protein
MALAHFEKLGDQLGIADVYRFFGIISVQEGDWEAAAAQFEESLRLNEQVENPLGLAEVYREYGKMHEAMEESEEALTKLRKSENLFRRLGAQEDAKEIRGRIAQLERRCSEKEVEAEMVYS